MLAYGEGPCEVRFMSDLVHNVIVYDQIKLFQYFMILGFDVIELIDYIIIVQYDGNINSLKCHKIVDTISHNKIE